MTNTSTTKSSAWRRLAVRVTTILVVLGTATLVAAVDSGQEARATTAPTSMVGQQQEDDPGWDCHTMGNRDCGPQVDAIQDFPGGMNVVLSTGVVLTCRDWDTTGAECNSADTVQHYLHAFSA